MNKIFLRYIKKCVKGRCKKAKEWFIVGKVVFKGRKNIPNLKIFKGCIWYNYSYDME